MKTQFDSNKYVDEHVTKDKEEQCISVMAL